MDTGEAIEKQGESSAEEKQTSITDSPEFKKALSDHLAKTGREAKALESRESKLREREDKFLKDEQDKELKELENVRDDPELLSIAQRKIKLAADIRKFNEDKSAFNKEKESLGDKLSKAEQAERTDKLEALAAEKGVDIESLKKAAEKITDFDVLSEIADLMTKTQKKTPKFDSGKDSGGGLSDSHFLKGWNSGSLPATQENIQRARRIATSK